MSINRILLVDDDSAVRSAISQTLRLENYDVIACGSFIEAKDHISKEFEGIVLTDIRMPGRDGFHLNEYCRDIDDDLPVIFLTGEGDIPMAVQAMSAGAFGFLEKPCSSENLLPVLSRALKIRGLVIENRNLKKQAITGDVSARMIFGRSPQVEHMRNAVRVAGQTKSDVIVTGAPGTGIAKIAEVIHLSSERAAGPLEKRSAINLSRQELLQIVNECENGTLFLDAIDQCPADTQLALIDFLEKEHNTRVIAGTHLEIADLEYQETFISDLFYRLATLTVRIPAISERREDIPVLYQHYVRQAAEQSGMPEPEITDQKISELLSRDWSGNTRALMHDAMRFVLGVNIEPSLKFVEGTESLGKQLSDFEKSILEKTLLQYKGRATQAANALKLPRKTFYDKLSKYGLRAENFRK